MTRSLAALALAGGLFGFAAAPALACERHTETAGNAAPAPQDATLASTTLRVESVTCGGCLVGIRKELTALKGVKAVNSGDDIKDVIMTFEKGALNDAQLVAAVKKAGYDAVVKTGAAPKQS